MKKNQLLSSGILVFFLLVTLTSIAQNQTIDLSKKIALKISIKGADSIDKADLIGRQIEKLQLALFSYVDPTSGIGYFIVENNEKEIEIQSTVNSEQGYSITESQQINLTDELFIEMYMKRGGFQKNEFATNTPKIILLGSNNDLTNSLYLKAIVVWKSLYSISYNKSIGAAEHHPIFVNTGNPNNDNEMYNQEKQNWVNNYPNEVEQMTGRSFQDATNKVHPIDVNKMKSSN